MYRYLELKKYTHLEFKKMYLELKKMYLKLKNVP